MRARRQAAATPSPANGKNAANTQNAALSTTGRGAPAASPARLATIPLAAAPSA